MTGASAQAAPTLLAVGTLSNPTDLSGLSGTVETGDPANILGGIGSGLAYAGNNTFLALPDRGPNATAWAGGTSVDNTTSYISRFQTVAMNLVATPGTSAFTLTPTLTQTTLLYSPTALNYGAVTPSINSSNKYYFDGRSDNFAAGISTNPDNARLDPEGIRVSNDGTKVYISDEYGPYVYEFDRATGQRTRTFNLPASFAVGNLSSQGATEISSNTSGRVANKGMEGLAITPDGKTLVGFEQSPLIQDGGDGGRANRIVTIDIATGNTTHQYVYDNKDGSKSYNSSEILAINDHEFLVLERDGKGLGDGTSAAEKKLFKIDLGSATDIGPLSISGESNLLSYAVGKSLFLDIKAELVSQGIAVTAIPAKLEGASFGDDVINGLGQKLHTLWIANDNDFVAGVAGPNKFFVFGFTDADLAGSSLQLQQVAAVPVPGAVWLFGSALLGMLGLRRNKA
ncbi:hypothetical protein [Methylomonas albis]|nr:hypothetical protein [Methylomonas albis]